MFRLFLLNIKIVTGVKMSQVCERVSIYMQVLRTKKPKFIEFQS